MAGEIDHQVAEPQIFFGLLGRLIPGQDFFHPQHQLAGTERLGQVIVGPKFEAQHSVDLGGLGRDHDDGNAGRDGILAQLLANLESVNLRQHHIQDNEDGGLGPGLFEGLKPVHRRGHGIAGLLEVELHQLHRFRLVIHH